MTYVVDAIAYNASLYNTIETGSDVVAKDITTEKRLFVEGDSNLSGRTFATGDVSLNSKLYVNNNVITIV